MKINWKVRLKNKSFWLMLIPVLFLLAQQVMSVFGISINFLQLEEEVLAIVGTIFAVMGTLGVVMDPTTQGVSDSELAMTYDKPKEDNE